MISTLAHLQLALADGAAAPSGDGGGAVGGCAGQGSTSLIFMLLMFAVFWFILIRPQQKRAKEHQAFLSALKKGDQVVTRGGIVGRVTGVADNNLVTIEIQEKVRVRVLKSYIESRHTEASSGAAADKAEKVEKDSSKSAAAESKN